MKEQIQELINDYYRKSITIREMMTDKANRKEPTITRLRAKDGCYQSFIRELQKLSNPL